MVEVAVNAEAWVRKLGAGQKAERLHRRAWNPGFSQVGVWWVPMEESSC